MINSISPVNNSPNFSAAFQVGVKGLSSQNVFDLKKQLTPLGSAVHDSLVVREAAGMDGQPVVQVISSNSLSDYQGNLLFLLIKDNPIVKAFKLFVRAMNTQESDGIIARREAMLRNTRGIKGYR